MNFVHNYLLHNLYWFTPIIIFPGVALFLMSLMMKYQAVAKIVLSDKHDSEKVRETYRRRLHCLCRAINLLYTVGIIFCFIAFLDIILVFWINKYIILFELLLQVIGIAMLAVGLYYAKCDISIVMKHCDFTGKHSD